MNDRTITRDLKVVAEGEGGNLTIFSGTSDIERVPYNSFLVRFTLKGGSSPLNKTGLHWHETHTEYLRVQSGKAFVTLNGITSIIDSNSGEICVQPGIVHQWGVVDQNELIIWERTEPDDGKKEIFFRNMISSLIDSQMGNPFLSQTVNRYLSIRDILQILTTFKSLDNYPVLWNGIGRRYITYFILNIGDLLGRIFFNLKPIYNEYTPQWLWDNHKMKSQ